ncbi:hypothetical protein [Endozoicomonas ascidiicola]|uniref:hypothetical protein n=1 Tax=Endozoicomonas ascidiicola TaxID=1698521 RepID=UPI00083564BE|nr:hypothetical protein [Endozoicomonas ascidiicola]
MSKGKNGQQIAQENIAKVEAWIAQRDAARDWEEYEYSGKINRRVLAEELDFAKSVCTQNKHVRSLLNEAEQRWFARKEESQASHEAARERAEKQSATVASNNNAMSMRIAELEAENRQLRKELKGYREQQAMVESGMAGFKL